MAYNEEDDVYTCHAGRTLTAQYIKKCTKSKKNIRLYVSKSYIEKQEESYQNILSETDSKYRMNRSIQVEGAFGALKKEL